MNIPLTITIHFFNLSVTSHLIILTQNVPTPPHKDKALRGLRALKIYNSAEHGEMQSSIEGHDT